MGGLAEIDLEDWKRNTDYDGYFRGDNVIIWFWKAVENYDNEMRARLLQFVTGTSKVPMNGFSELQGMLLHVVISIKIMPVCSLLCTLFMLCMLHLHEKVHIP